MKYINLFEDFNPESSTPLSNPEDAILLDSAEWTVVVPKTFDSALYWSEGTFWEITKSSPEVFDSLTEEGDMFIIIDKTHNEKYQFHIPSDTLCDSNNRFFPFSSFFTDKPEVKEAIESRLSSYDKPALKAFQNLTQI
jgi:hypothetical protein